MKPGLLAAASVQARRSGRLVGRTEWPIPQTTVIGTYALRREVHCQVHLSLDPPRSMPTRSTPSPCGLASATRFRQHASELLEVSFQNAHPGPAVQNRRWMIQRQNRHPCICEEPPVDLGERPPRGKLLQGDPAQGDDDGWMDDTQLLVEPGPAGRNFVGRRWAIAPGPRS